MTARRGAGRSAKAKGRLGRDEFLETLLSTINNHIILQSA